MVNPPTKEGNYSDETVEKYLKESNDILYSLAHRAEIVSSLLNEMENVKCNEVEGAMVENYYNISFI